MNCPDIRALVVHHLEENLRASSRGGQGCTITLPLKTLDDRWVSVIVEDRFGYFVVHDVAQTDSILFSHGLRMSDVDEQFNAAIAIEYGVSIQDKVIQKTCRRDNLPETIMAVGESAVLMTTQLVSSRLVEIEVQEVHTRVSEALRLWRPPDVEIEQNVEIVGNLSTYKWLLSQ
jgi:hypothetical protein